jgi:altronate hydrolase
MLPAAMSTEPIATTKVLRIHPADNVLVALGDLRRGEAICDGSVTVSLLSDVSAKHKFSTRDLAVGDGIFMYGILVGKATKPIAAGDAITTLNTRHEAAQVTGKNRVSEWHVPDITVWRNTSWSGYRREDGLVGTRNYWIVLPLVFCENRNIDAMRQAFVEELGFAAPQKYRALVARLLKLYREGKSDQIGDSHLQELGGTSRPGSAFPHVDGIKFLTHQGGCGGTRDDARALCGLLAGYIHNPNVAGATVLSLGCQHAQADILLEELEKRDPSHTKKVLVFEQQRAGTESNLLSKAIQDTFLGLVEANNARRTPASLAALTLGLKCGGSDGFSGISANPTLGHVSDKLAALGGRTILSEFPELCGVEQALVNRCVSKEAAERFLSLMSTYNSRAHAVGSGFDMNPSPGNIRDGLITDAMKSAGAAKKGGSSPVTAVLDYPEYAEQPGLNLLCTPGNDVESVTAQVGSGANMVLFTTGLGTPTGNPVAPVVKISTNSRLAERMSDIIDFDCGAIISGQSTPEETSDQLLDMMVRVASGELKTKAEMLDQDDFIPWKRGVSL